jgi:hypothetical protein
MGLAPEGTVLLYVSVLRRCTVNFMTHKYCMRRLLCLLHAYGMGSTFGTAFTVQNYTSVSCPHARQTARLANHLVKRDQKGSNT